MNKPNCIKFADALVKVLKTGESSMAVLKWNTDLNCSCTTAMSFIGNIASTVGADSKLETLELKHIFTKRTKRQKMRDELANSSANKVSVKLWEPEFTDDESAENSFTEDDSQEAEEDDPQDEALDDDPAHVK